MFFALKSAQPERLDAVARLYLAYKFLGALYTTYPIFYEFSLQTISPIQIGLFFSVIGVCGFIAEVPTGIVADKYGRKSSGVLGTLLLAIAPLIIFFGHTFATYMIAAVLYGLGRALLSGALESLVYDHKNVSKQVYRRVNALEITFGQAGILMSAALGGVLFGINQSLPFITEAITGLACCVIISAMREQNKDDHIIPTASHRQHFVQSVQHLFATPFLRVLVLMGVTFSVMLGMCIQFVNEATMIEHGLQSEARGFLIAGAGLATLAIVHIVIRTWVTSDVARLYYMAFGALTAYVSMSLQVMPLFLTGYLLWCCLNATSSFLRLMVHDRIPGSHRSTIMSNFKALAVLIGMGASTATGVLVQQAGTPRAAYAVFAVIALFVLLPCMRYLITRTDFDAVMSKD